MTITARPRHMGAEYTYENERVLDNGDPGQMRVDALPVSTEHHNIESHLHDHEAGHEHEHAHVDESSANPRRWRRIAGFLFASSIAEVAVEAAAEHQPRAAIGLDAFHTLLADLPDYLARGEAKIVPLGMLAVGATLFGDKVNRGFSKAKEKVVGGAMIAGNAAAMAYTGWDVAGRPEQYNPLEFPAHDWKSYVAPAIGLVAVSAASRIGRKFRNSHNHTDREGAEHLEIDRSDAEGRLIGAALNPFTAAAAAMWYGGKGIKFAANRLIKGEHSHAHGENSERRARLWRRTRYAVGGLALAGSLVVQTPHDTEPATPEATVAADEVWGGADALDPPAVTPESETPLAAPLVMNLPEWNPDTGDGSVWGLAEDQAAAVLGRDVTNAEVFALTAETLEQNNWTWQDGPELQEGMPVQMLGSGQARQAVKAA